MNIATFGKDDNAQARELGEDANVKRDGEETNDEVRGVGTGGEQSSEANASTAETLPAVFAARG